MAATSYQANISHVGTGVNVDIVIDGEKGVKHDYDRNIKNIIPIPKQDTTLTLIIDIKRYIHRVTITGTFEDDSGTTGSQKKGTFETILKEQGPFVLSWGSESYSGSIDKSIINEVVGEVDYGDLPSGTVTRYDVTLTFIEGEIRG